MASQATPRIHPTAIIDPSARLHETVSVGPYSIVGANVEIGADTVIGPHVVLKGPMRIGARNRIFQFSSLGEISQDKTARDDDATSVVIGDDNTIREYVTIQRGTLKTLELNHGETRVGSGNWIMANTHIAHDCIVGSQTILANGVTLAGHVTIEDYAGLGGFVLIHQHCCIGASAYIGGGALIRKDVMPFLMVEGEPARPRGINAEGLKRRGYTAEDIDTIKDAYKLVYLSGALMPEVKEKLAAMAQASPHCRQMLEFIERSKRSLLR